MKANEITGLSEIRMSALPAYRSHSHLLFRLQRAIPTHKSQLKYFTGLDCLCMGDVNYITNIFPEADFKWTKSKGFVRLTNFTEFKKILTYKLNNE